MLHRIEQICHVGGGGIHHLLQLTKGDLNSVVFADILEGIADHGIHATAVHRHVGNGIALADRDAESLIVTTVHTYSAVGRDAAASSIDFNGVVDGSATTAGRIADSVGQIETAAVATLQCHMDGVGNNNDHVSYGDAPVGDGDCGGLRTGGVGRLRNLRRHLVDVLGLDQNHQCGLGAGVVLQAPNVDHIDTCGGHVVTAQTYCIAAIVREGDGVVLTLYQLGWLAAIRARDANGQAIQDIAPAGTVVGQNDEVLTVLEGHAAPLEAAAVLQVNGQADKHAGADGSPL